MKRTGAGQRTRHAIAALACVFWPSAADAHLASTGMGPLYDGLVHFATSPVDLLSAAALALWSGLGGPERGRRTMFALPPAWLVGGLLGATRSAESGLDAVVGALALMVLGGLLASGAKLSLRATAIVAACVGLLLGWANGAGMGAPFAAVVPLLGLDAAVFTLAALAAALATKLRSSRARIALRVLGSWIAAIGLLSLGWALRGS